MKRLWIQQYQKLTILQIIGLILLFLGILALTTIGLASLQPALKAFVVVDTSTTVAIAFLFIMLGIALVYPDMLKSPDKSSYSSMRIVVFMIVSLFSFLVAKIGWNCKSLSDFQIHSGWAAIISAALGSKAVQSLGENHVFGNSKNVVLPTGTNTLFNASGNGNQTDAVLHNSSFIDHNPPVNPPAHISLAKP